MVLSWFAPIVMCTRAQTFAGEMAFVILSMNTWILPKLMNPAEIVMFGERMNSLATVNREQAATFLKIRKFFLALQVPTRGAAVFSPTTFGNVSLPGFAFDTAISSPSLPHFSFILHFATSLLHNFSHCSPLFPCLLN